MAGDMVPTADYTPITAEDDALALRAFQEALSRTPSQEYLAEAARITAMLRSPEHQARRRELGLRTADGGRLTG